MTAKRDDIAKPLTPAVAWRRVFGGCTALLILVLPLNAGGDELRAHAAAEIRATAEAYLATRTNSSDTSTSVTAAGFDNRHRLPQCDAPLQGFLRRGTRIQARTIVGVRCTGSRPWKVYVPVDVAVSSEVLVAARPLPRGHLMSAADVRVERRDVSRLRHGYLADAKALLGQRLRAPLLAGTVLTPAVLQADDLVRRGQSVTITANLSGIAVNMSGKALADGGLGQRIRVENSNSGRIVEAIVRSREQVEVLLPANTNLFTARPKVSPNPADTGSSNNDR